MIRTSVITRFLVGIAILVVGTVLFGLFLGEPDGSGEFVLGIIYFFVLGFIVGFVINHWVALLLGALAFDVYVIWRSYPGEDWQDLLPWNLLNGSTPGAAVFWVMVLVALASAFGVKARRVWLR